MTTSPRAGAHRARRRAAGLFVLPALLAIAFGCKNDLTGLGRQLRTPPDSLQLLEYTSTLMDTVFPVPVALGKSPVGQVGQRIGYTAHVLYAFQVPTRSADGDSLDALRLVIQVAKDSTGTTPQFETMRLRLREVAPEAREWTQDSVLVALPETLATALAPDVVLDGDDFVKQDAADTDPASFTFNLKLDQLSGYASAFAAGESLDVNVALIFAGLEGGAPGFLEIPYGSRTSTTAKLIGDSEADPANAIFSLGPERRVTVVAFDNSFPIGTNFLVSDGYRQHTYVRMTSPRELLPESAIVLHAELILTQVEGGDGSVFGRGLTRVGVMAPTDTTMLYSVEQNTLALEGATELLPSPGANIGIVITRLVTDAHNGKSANLDILLRLANEGTKVRHYEFYGARDPDPARRPLVRVIWGLPSDFGGN